MLGVDAALLHDFGARRAQAELMQTDYLSVQSHVLIPNLWNARFDGDTAPARFRQDFFAIFFRFALEAFKTWHRDDTHPIPQLLGRRHSMLQFAAARHDDQIEITLFFFCDVP